MTNYPHTPPGRAHDPGNPPSTLDRWRRLPRIIRWPVYVLAAITVLGILTPADDDTPTAADPEPAPASSPAPDPEPAEPELTDAQRERRELRETYTRNDARTCRAYADSIADLLTGDGTTDDALTAATDMRTLAERADDAGISYALEGIANDLDGMLRDGVTSANQQALEGNIAAATMWCDKAQRAYPGA